MDTGNRWDRAIKASADRDDVRRNGYRACQTYVTGETYLAETWHKVLGDLGVKCSGLEAPTWDYKDHWHIDIDDIRFWIEKRGCLGDYGWSEWLDIRATIRCAACGRAHHTGLLRVAADLGDALCQTHRCSPHRNDPDTAGSRWYARMARWAFGL